MKNTMRWRYLLVTIISVTIFGEIILLIVSGFMPPSAVDQARLTIDVPVDLEEPFDLYVNTGTAISITAEPVASQVTLAPNGQTLIESHCAQCHLAQELKKIEKSRIEWEKALEKMEGLGVHLEDAETVLLLDYLAPVGTR